MLRGTKICFLYNGGSGGGSGVCVWVAGRGGGGGRGAEKRAFVVAAEVVGCSFHVA